jgi:hypothetical protein
MWFFIQPNWKLPGSVSKIHLPYALKSVQALQPIALSNKTQGIADPEAKLGPVGGSSFHQAVTTALGLIGKESP